MIVGRGVERSLRKNPAAVRSVLDSLDQAGGPNPAESRRRCPRYVYRPPVLTVELPQPNGDLLPHAVASRNISRLGVSFLIGRFVYPGTHCTVHLSTLCDLVLPVAGLVRRCRYLRGTGSLHEVAVRFDHPVDVALLHPDARPLRILIVDAAPAHGLLVGQLLKSLDAEIVVLADGHQAVETALSKPFDVILAEVNIPDYSGSAAAADLRQRGYVRPLIGIAGAQSAQARTECLQAGFDALITKPVTRAELKKVIHAVLGNPIVSTFMLEPALAEATNSFVAGLPERIAALETAFRAPDLETIRRVVREVQAEGGACGFESIGAAAAAVEETLAKEGQPAAGRKAVATLVRLCLAARPATVSDAPPPPASDAKADPAPETGAAATDAPPAPTPMAAPAAASPG